MNQNIPHKGGCRARGALKRSAAIIHGHYD
jgi:hypothetical protein